MIFDRHNMFSDKQAVTATAASSFVIDSGPGAHKATTPPWLVVLLNGYSGTGSMQVEVQTSDSASFASNVKTVAIFPLDNPTLAANGKAVACSIPQTALPSLELQCNRHNQRRQHYFRACRRCLIPNKPPAR